MVVTMVVTAAVTVLAMAAVKVVATAVVVIVDVRGEEKELNDNDEEMDAVAEVGGLWGG